MLDVLARQEDDDDRDGGQVQYQLPTQIVAKMQRAAAKKRKQQQNNNITATRQSATHVAGAAAGAGVPQHPQQDRPPAPPAGPPLPADWEARYDPSSSGWYYFNGGTGVSTWLRPLPAVANKQTPAAKKPMVAFAGLGDYGSSSDSD